MAVIVLVNDQTVIVISKKRYNFQMFFVAIGSDSLQPKDGKAPSVS